MCCSLLATLLLTLLMSTSFTCVQGSSTFIAQVYLNVTEESPVDTIIGSLANHVTGAQFSRSPRPSPPVSTRLSNPRTFTRSVLSAALLLVYLLSHERYQ